VTTHKVQLRQFPVEVLLGLARVADDVLDRLAGADPLSGKVYESLTAFRREALGWSRISEESYLAARLLPFKSGA
jgi:TRAP-type mannitol/chloroaromatic compound transport system substrate-binding protein